MTHTQWRRAVTVVVIQEQRVHTILGPVHKRVLSCLRFLSFQSCRVPGLLVFNLSVVSFFMIMERLPNSMGSWVLRVKLPPINSSFIVNSKQFRSIFPSPGGWPLKAVMITRLASAIGVFQHIGYTRRPLLPWRPPPEAMPWRRVVSATRYFSGEYQQVRKKNIPMKKKMKTSSSVILQWHLPPLFFYWQSIVYGPPILLC